ncbi:MAG: glutathione synthase [Desulfobacteraceae bacterium]|nr:MAG: glutathione synthase [Desulfobacteraceae bacterium]
MRIAYIMDEIASIDPVWETTSHLMYECNQRGHSVYFLEPHDIYIRDSTVVARMHNVSVAPDMHMQSYWRALVAIVEEGERIFESITDLDAMFLRKNPPLDYRTMEYLAPYESKVFMINSTAGQIRGNSKLYPLNFPGIIPETHVSKDPKRLLKIIEEFGGAMVVKPLQRFGGEGVIKVSTADRENLTSLIHYYTRASRPYREREPIMVQAFLESAKTEGDVRILLLDGEILGAMQRIPQAGDFRTNVHAGGSVRPHTITPAERAVCEAIKERLIQDGLYFVGLDLIDGKLIEVNCVSPGGIPRINHLDHVHLEARVIDFIERNVAGRKHA